MIGFSLLLVGVFGLTNQGIRHQTWQFEKGGVADCRKTASLRDLGKE
jgi:hypothetical protein